MKTNLLTILTILSITLIFSCSQEKTQVAKSADYEKYLQHDQNPEIETLQKELSFWNKKFEASPTQYPYQLKIAGANSALFQRTGKIEYLNDAYKLLQAVNKKTNNTMPSYLRALARNCISQHKFKEAHAALLHAEKEGDQLRSTQKMLFDVNLELGNAEDAEEYLKAISSKQDFDYLIRMAKWSDHEGDLDAAIAYMEQARDEAERLNNDGLVLWSATNLGDFYGHAGRIEDSYKQYLKSLEVDPYNTYALKGIAWINFSNDKNITEAKTILKALQQRSAAPDYDLLLAEISEYEEDSEAQEKLLASFTKKTSIPLYGDMYNTYLAEIEEGADAILKIAQTEVANRPTPMSYSLLAWGYHKKGDAKKALSIIEKNVANKTFEPSAQYRMAVIYKSNNMLDQTDALKAELGGSFYELGPVMGRKIGSL